MNIRKTFFACAFSLAFSFAFPVTAPKHPDSMNVSWRVLENAQVAYDSTMYGEALNLANKAKESRRAEIEWENYILESALSPLAVRRVGDFFSDVLNILLLSQFSFRAGLLGQGEVRLSRGRFPHRENLPA